MGALADTLTLNRALIQEMRDDYGYVDGLVPDMKWPKDTTTHSLDLGHSSGSNIIGDFFQWLGQLSPAFWYTLLGLLLLLLLVWVIRHMKDGRVKRKKTVEAEEETPVDIYAVDRPQEELDRAVSAKDWAQAVRMTYILTLRHLHEEGRIEWLPNKTPLDFLRAVGMMPFLQLTNAFLRVRFGKYPATEDDWHAAAEWRRAAEKGGGA